MELPGIISDLALMLLLAGIITIIFKKLNQPLVLGYLVAGFLVSSYCTIFPTVSDAISIETWSEIGIIMLMFTLGLEFNLHKLARVGGTAIITATIEVIGLALLGFGVGQIMGWTIIESLFLGGMLSMSSTTIIIKAFEDLEVRKEKFTDTVLGILIIEDIAGIFMMIMLTTLSVSQNVNGMELAMHMLSMLLYLALWLIASIFLIPTFINKAKRLINNETLLIIALGTCFGMVLLANYLGFSTALGAFLAGSIFAGTSQGERTERVVKPIRDLFGAVFFISVGMMVQPAMLVKYWLPIIIITFIVMFCKPLIGCVGMMLSGQTLHTAVRTGSSLAQVGEFSFIIAALGRSLGVIGDFIYPVIVSVSVVTTFTTPFFIKHGEGIYHKLEAALPEKLRRLMQRYTSERRSEKEKDQDWYQFIRVNVRKVALHSMICIAVNIAVAKLLLPWLNTLLPLLESQLISIGLILLICSPFLNALLRPKDKYFVNLWTRDRSNRLPLSAFTALRIIIALALILMAFYMVFSFFSPWIALVALVLLVIFSRSRWLTSSYLRVEARFLSNLNERQLAENESMSGDHAWLDEKLQVARITLPDDESIVGQTLAQLRWGAVYGVNVIKIVRGKKHINIPEGHEQLHERDILYTIGDDTQLATWLRALNFTEEYGDMPDLRSFINSQDEQLSPHSQLLSYALKVERGMDLAHKSIRDAGIKSRFFCVLIGLERDMLPIYHPSPDMVLRHGDILWLLGTDKMGSELLRSDMLPPDIPPGEEADEIELDLETDDDTEEKSAEQ